MVLLLDGETPITSQYIPKIVIHPPTPLPEDHEAPAVIKKEDSKYPLIDVSTEKTVFDEKVGNLDSSVTELISKHFSKETFKDEGDKVRKEVMKTVDVVSHSLYKRGYTFNDLVQCLERINSFLDLSAMKELIVNFPTKREQEIIKHGRHNAAYMLCMAIDGKSDYVFNLLKLFVSTHDLISKVCAVDNVCRQASSTIGIMKGPEIATLLQTALQVANAANYGSDQFNIPRIALSELPNLLGAQSKAGEAESTCLADFVASLLPFNEKQLVEVKTSIQGFSSRRKELLEVPKLIGNIKKMETQQISLGNDDVQAFYAFIRWKQLERLEYTKEFQTHLLEMEETVKSTICADMDKPLTEAAEVLVLSLNMVLVAMEENRFGKLINKTTTSPPQKVHTNLDSESNNVDKFPLKRQERRNRLSSKLRQNSDKPKTTRCRKVNQQSKVDDCEIEIVPTNEGDHPSVPGPAPYNFWRRMRGFFRDKVRTLQAEYAGWRDYLRWRRHLL